MYNISKLSPKTAKYISELTSNSRSKSKLVSVVLAKTLSLDIPVPTEKVENIEKYYNVNCKVDIYNKLYIINELFVIDIDFIAKLTGQFFTWKYERVFCKELGIIRTKETAILDFFDITDHFALSDLKVLAESKDETIYHQLNIKDLVDGLFSEGENDE